MLTLGEEKECFVIFVRGKGEKIFCQNERANPVSKKNDIRTHLICFSLPEKMMWRSGAGLKFDTSFKKKACLHRCSKTITSKKYI